MKNIENMCVDCGLTNTCSSCPYRKMAIYYCDVCGKEGAEYDIDGDDYCEDCAKDYINETFNFLSMSEQAKLLEINLRKYDSW